MSVPGEGRESKINSEDREVDKLRPAPPPPHRLLIISFLTHFTDRSPGSSVEYLEPEPPGS